MRPWRGGSLHSNVEGFPKIPSRWERREAPQTLPFRSTRGLPSTGQSFTLMTADHDREGMIP